MNPIYLRNTPGHPETYDHISMIDHLASWIKPESYLEIGVRDGRSLNVVSKYSKECHAVDLQFLHKNFNWYLSDTYFITLKIKFKKKLLAFS
jgi:hypothetical protein